MALFLILAGAAASVLYYGLNLQALTVFLVFCVLTRIAAVDIISLYIPAELNLLLAFLGIVSYWTLPGPSVIERLSGAVCISVPLFLIVLVIPDGFGGGDIKMMASSGLLLGVKGNIAAFFIGLLLGGAYGIYLLLTKKKGRKDHFAFGPFLSIGIAVSLYAGTGEALVDWYLGMIMPMNR